jgi:hypothetical protein
MNGGAVREERSPLKDAMDCKEVRGEQMLRGSLRAENNHLQEASP